MGRINIGSAFSGLTGGADAPKDRIVMLNPAELSPWRNPYTGEAQPFRVLESKLTDLEESVKSHGILNPILARRLDDRIEIVAGERRWRVANRLELQTVPVVLRTMTDEEAIIILVDTNLTARDEILPSEKAAAYKLRLDALKRQGKRTDLIEGDFSHNSYEQVASDVGESARQVQRFVRLNHLVPELQTAVDEGRIPLGAAVELSYVSQDKQQEAVERIQEGEVITVAQAKEHREEAKGSQDEYLPLPEDIQIRKKIAGILQASLGASVGLVFDPSRFEEEIERNCSQWHGHAGGNRSIQFTPKKIYAEINMIYYRLRLKDIRELLLDFPDENFKAVPTLEKVLKDLRALGEATPLSPGAQAAVKMLRSEVDRHLVTQKAIEER